MNVKSCDHEYEVDPIVLDCNPPIYSRSCKRCGWFQWGQEKDGRMVWHDGKVGDK